MVLVLQEKDDDDDDAAAGRCDAEVETLLSGRHRWRKKISYGFEETTHTLAHTQVTMTMIYDDKRPRRKGSEEARLSDGDGLKCFLLFSYYLVHKHTTDLRGV